MIFLQRASDHANFLHLPRISPEGVDIILDCLCGDDCNRGYGLLKPMGKYILFGSSNVVTGETKSFFSVARSVRNLSQRLMVHMINPRISHFLVVASRQSLADQAFRREQDTHRFQLASFAVPARRCRIREERCQRHLWIVQGWKDQAGHRLNLGS